jgi:DNA polymerase III alpha subunit
MFDMLGQSADIPLPALSLQSYDVELQQKLEWEKELMGVYFSEHPLTALGPKLAELATILCGEITADMSGEKVTVAGMVASVRHATTKNNRVFVIVNFEDLNGNTEITVWSDVYTQTQDLWIEGSILIIDGTVRVREDRVSISCVKARRYEPGRADESAPKSNGVHHKPAGSNNGNINGNSYANSNVNGNGSHTPLPKKLVINISQSDDSERDLDYFKKIMNVLRRYPGNDTVQLAIRKNDKVTRMDIPDIKVQYCNELVSEIAMIQGQ